MKLHSLRDPYHNLPNMMSGITLAMGGFSVIYTEEPDSINTATKDELYDIIKRMEEYYERAIGNMSAISKIFDIIGTLPLAQELKSSIEGDLKEIKMLIDKTKNSAGRISDNNLKGDIRNIINEMQPLQEVCESVANSVSQDVEKLQSHNIYYKLYNEKGEIVPKILFADYEKETNESLKSYFSEKGYVAFTIAKSDDILDAIRKERPDLVCLDVKLPGKISGIDALKEIKQFDSRIKVIMDTVFTEEELKEEFGEETLTADAYIKKPFSLVDLEALINKLAPLGERVKL